MFREPNNKDKLLPNQLFQQYRNRANLTQMEVARLVKLKSYQAVGFWEEGRSLPKAVNLKNLVELYLYRGVFSRGEETAEVRQLWTTVKDLQDSKLNLTTPYPVFDHLWFKDLLQAYNASSQNQISIQASTPEARPDPKTADDRVRSEVNSISARSQEKIPDANFPRPLTRLVGRETDLALLTSYLVNPDLRLITLCGPGGTGKTRLAIELARTLSSYFEDGTFFVDVSSLRDPNLLIGTIARAFGFVETGTRSGLFEQLKSYLDAKQLLVVLDNFEQIVEAAPTLTELLSGTTHLKILVTSREVLQIKGEQRFEVQPLTLPTLENNTYLAVDLSLSSHLLPTPDPVADLARVASVALFLQCARAVKPDFKLTSSNQHLVVKLCQRLDGLPLAIELASYHLKTFTLEQMLSRLNKGLEILDGGKRHTPSRQQTLQMTLDWSYALLNEADKTLFTQLAVFSHSFTVEAAEKVVNLDSVLNGQAVWEIVEALLSKSLISEFQVSMPSQNSDEPVRRFRMLETIREYALDRLQKSGGENEVRKRHASYFTALAGEAVSNLGQPNQPTWLELDQDNLRAALDWCLEANEWQSGLRLVSFLWRFWRFWGVISEGRRYLDLVLAAVPPGAEPAAEWWSRYTEALYGAGILAIRQSDFKVGARFLLDDLDLAEKFGDSRVKAQVLCGLGELYRREARYEKALDCYNESLALFEQLSDQTGLGTVYHNLGSLFRLQGDYARARTYAEAGLSIWRHQNNMLGLTATYNDLAEIALAEGKYAESRFCCQQSLTFKDRLGDKTGRARLLLILGYISLVEGDYQEAYRLYSNSLDLIRLWEDKSSLAGCLNGLGMVCLGRAAVDQAALDQANTLFYQSLRLAQATSQAESIVCSLFGLAEVLSRQGEQVRAIRLCSAAQKTLNNSSSTLTLSLYQEMYEQTLLDLRIACPAHDFELAWEQGQKYSLDELLSESLDGEQLSDDTASYNLPLNPPKIS